MKIALCQTTVHKDWHKNLRNAERVIADAVKSKADMVVLLKNVLLNAKGSESLLTHYFFTQKQRKKAMHGHFIKSVLCGVG